MTGRRPAFFGKGLFKGNASRFGKVRHHAASAAISACKHRGGP